ncbi:hypothetical protein QFC19_001981 [Naganishia cerealis]|uniref:Uncharacterized protein n=1 Tax=Naganishia cerealis TaxID=610337 RepID=A0ACC2WFY2_9TREE|nr:hypothetical protein QFC19_001981 [Naganishia cerealis]
MTAQTNGNSNGTPSRKFENGVYTPLTTPMTEDEQVDIAALRKQVVRLANAGMGIVLLGTNGEASHLMDHERESVIKASREALDSAGHQNVPLLVGTGGGSAKHTIALAEQAKAAGADYSIVICPGYFAFAMGSNKDAVKGFFKEVLDHSVLPVMIYNFPDIMYPGMAVGMTGSITGTGTWGLFAFQTKLRDLSSVRKGNIIPKTMVKLYNVGKRAIDTGDREAKDEALDLHRRVAAADWIVVKAGISGTKLALDTFVEKGLGGVPRKPLPRATEDTVKLVEDLRPFWEYESTL